MRSISADYRINSGHQQPALELQTSAYTFSDSLPGRGRRTMSSFSASHPLFGTYSAERLTVFAQHTQNVTNNDQLTSPVQDPRQPNHRQPSLASTSFCIHCQDDLYGQLLCTLSAKRKVVRGFYGAHQDLLNHQPRHGSHQSGEGTRVSLSLTHSSIADEYL